MVKRQDDADLPGEPKRVSALDALWAHAEAEYEEFENNTEGPGFPDDKSKFCIGYIFGCGFGLALSTVRTDLVESFEPIYRKRGWLDGHAEFVMRKTASKTPKSGNGHPPDSGE